MVHKWWMVSALESEMWKAGHLDTSKIVDYRDIQNISEELSQSQGDLPMCENHPLASTTATEAVAVPSSAQNTFEELSKSKVTTLNAETVLLFIPPLWRFLRDRVQNTSEELSHSQCDPRVCENRSLISTTATEAVTGLSIAQSTSEEASHFQGDLAVFAKAFLLLLTLLWRLFPGLLVSKTHFNSCLIPKLKTLNAETVQLLLQILRRMLRDLHVSKISLKNCPSPKVTTLNAETVSVFLPPLQRLL
ncbi:hypothetical protein AVEN_24414-1 [Araneus ventricosus]|uniref:Uncharacterized protein n=1 Tax=Araneus ventricosus TaxID=182803 RepID=A0A4Y2MW95_ARAVE|nr:hypothetical protein AVEN_24414-1 [Araneus ventricosus]